MLSTPPRPTDNNKNLSSISSVTNESFTTPTSDEQSFRAAIDTRTITRNHNQSANAAALRAIANQPDSPLSRRATAVVAPTTVGDDSNENFVPANVNLFGDPTDILDNYGDSAAASDLYRQSLYTKFDPLAPKLPSQAQQQPQLPTIAQHHASSPHSDDLFSMQTPSPASSTRSAASKPEIDTGTITLKNKKLRPTIERMACDDTIDKLLAISPQAGAAVSDEINSAVQHLRLQLQAEMAAKEREWQELYANTSQNLQDTRSELQQKKDEISGLNMVITEYEKTVQQTIAGGGATMKTGSGKMESVEDAVKHRDQALEDLSGVESSFADLHRRYEKLRASVEEQKLNGEKQTALIETLYSKVAKAEDRFCKLKSHAEERLEQANDEVERQQQLRESDTLSLRAQLKRAELQIESQRQLIDQKDREISELSSICDELIKKSSIRQDGI